MDFKRHHDFFCVVNFERQGSRDILCLYVSLYIVNLEDQFRQMKWFINWYCNFSCQTMKGCGSGLFLLSVFLLVHTFCSFIVKSLEVCKFLLSADFLLVSPIRWLVVNVQEILELTQQFLTRCELALESQSWKTFLIFVLYYTVNICKLSLNLGNLQLNRTNITVSSSSHS